MTTAHPSAADGAGEPVAGRVVIVSARIGAGHDGAARELARRLRLGGFRVDRVDFLDLLPGRLGEALCALYRWQLSALRTSCHLRPVEANPGNGASADTATRATPTTAAATSPTSHHVTAADEKHEQRAALGPGQDDRNRPGQQRTVHPRRPSSSTPDDVGRIGRPRLGLDEDRMMVPSSPGPAGPASRADDLRTS